MSTDPKFNRNYRALTSEYVLTRLEGIDEMLAETTNGGRIAYLIEQRTWWERNLEFCRKREARSGYTPPQENPKHDAAG